jgi:hypothetical protein
MEIPSPLSDAWIEPEIAGNGGRMRKTEASKAMYPTKGALSHTAFMPKKLNATTIGMKAALNFLKLCLSLPLLAEV